MGYLTEDVMAYMCIGKMVKSVINNGAIAEYVWEQNKCYGETLKRSYYDLHIVFLTSCRLYTMHL